MNKPELVLYFDIETASKYKTVEEFESNEKEMYKRFFNKYDSYDKASINPAYGLITCISLGYYVNNKLKIKSFVGEEEEILKNSYKGFVQAHNKQYSLCGYNIKNFDLPWLNIKMLKYGLKIPGILSLFDKKPWELNIFDPYLELNTRSLSLYELTNDLGITSPVLHGNEMNNFYWNNEIDKIIYHCESDLKSIAELYKTIYNLTF
ncbi:MAG: ribonuclease H-like domain-containing protein [archaeon]